MGLVDGVQLLLSAATMEQYCGELERRSPTLEKRIAALDALITFIARHSEPAEQAKEEYAAIRATLSRHFEQARGELLQQQGRNLIAALRAHDLGAIARTFGALSRDSFWQLLQQAEGEMTRDENAGVARWCGQWMQQAEARATAASPYPDAIDLKAAGIAVVDYSAMRDLCRFYGV